MGDPTGIASKGDALNPLNEHWVQRECKRGKEIAKCLHLKRLIIEPTLHTCLATCLGSFQCQWSLASAQVSADIEPLEYTPKPECLCGKQMFLQVFDSVASSPFRHPHVL